MDSILYTIRISAVHRPFYISICISTLPTQHTTFTQKNLTGVLLWNNTDDCKAWFTTSDISISTKSIRKQSMIYPLGRVNTKQREFFFVSSFVLLLAYASTMFLCLCICRSTCRRLDCIRLCFAFCLSLCLCR